MRYRKLDANDDFSFGHGSADFHKDTPDAVAQAVKTRLALFTGEWFLDQSDGTPWMTDVLGAGTQTTYNLAIRERILDTQGVREIVSYSSSQNRDTRSLTVTATIETVYGLASLTQVI